MNKKAAKVAKKIVGEAASLAKEIKDPKQKKKQKKTLKYKNRALRMNMRPNTWGNETSSSIGGAIREAKAYDSVDGAYIKCVFDPLTHKPSRIPSIFPSPTALFKYTHNIDITVPATSTMSRSYILIQPWNLIEGGTTASTIPSFINIGEGTVAIPANEYTRRVPHLMQGFMGDLQAPASRFTSYRAVSCQAVLECVAPVLNLQGNVTGAFFPGLGFNSVSGGTPTSTQLIQHPFGFQRAVKDLSSEWPFQVNYFPLDPLDQVFHNASEPSDDIKNRSPMFIVFDNFTQSVQFRVRVTTVIEYCPTLTFSQWSNTDFGFDAPRTMEVIRSIVTTNGKVAVAGGLDREIARLPNKTTGDDFISFIKKAGRVISGVTDEIGGIPKLFGSALRAGVEVL